MRVETSHFEIFRRQRGRCRACATTLKGHQVDCKLYMIRDGAQAIQRRDKLDTDPKAPLPDLMLLDLHLPKRDGEHILKRLRSTERYSGTPVVLMTSHDSNAIGQTAARHEALVYFKKPTTFDDFMELGLIVRRVPAGGRNAGDPEPAPSEESAGSAA